MKKLPVLSILAFLLTFVSLISAETVMVKFVSGNVKIKNTKTGKWITPKVRMKIDDSYIVKTGKNGKIQFLTKSGKIAKVNSSKTLQIQNLFSTSKKSGMQSKLALLKSKLSKGQSGSQYGATAVAGIRGADVQKQRARQMKQTLYWEE